MKLSTLLGTFALSTLEAYHAYASPLEAVSPGAQSLEGRGSETCCVLIQNGNERDARFIAYDGKSESASFTSLGCQFRIHQGPTPPSRGGCTEWNTDLVLCHYDPVPVFSIQPANICQK
ncbi:hypothetical protein E4U30_004193 [Claviceps sp. LM220 group G6]|nr:hypothetical protein E4U15_002051 [Claviceps sp. LM218 group G6]KAG6093580.1 hypothetical protein E4U30_004193 [Claviceps sp. LM220 group G6]KAG6113242.1 hypothetical protein E4U31_001362 [Claviceps sp. LM219 group G6]